MVAAREWPHSNLGANLSDTIDHWHSVLSGIDNDTAQCALLELVVSGREHAPSAGAVARQAADRETDVPDWDEAWRECAHLLKRWSPAYPGREVPPAEAFSHPAVAAFAIPAWRELALGPAPGTRDHGTFYAQQREAYKAISARASRGAALQLVGAPRRRELERKSFHRLLPGGDTAA